VQLPHFRAAPDQLVGPDLSELGHVTNERFPERFAGRIRIDVRPADRLLDDFIDHLEPEQILGGELERLGRPLPLAGVLPQNSGAPFG
jgi:hypothetical protein